MVNDEVLMVAFRGGSREAFEELFARYRDPIYGYFHRRLVNPERARDLTQDTFVALMRGAPRYVPTALFRTYLYGIAIKLLWAERRRNRHEELRQSASEPSYEEAHEDSLWVRQALQKLDMEDREVLMLREYEQLSYAEIAEILEIPLNTVRSRLFRSRLALRACLEPVRSQKREA